MKENPPENILNKFEAANEMRQSEFEALLARSESKNIKWVIGTLLGTLGIAAAVVVISNADVDAKIAAIKDSTVASVAAIEERSAVNVAAIEERSAASVAAIEERSAAKVEEILQTQGR
ncbi:MAG: hypothetical protein COA60_004030 [Robiginitomaculum sp.]|nr:hypothetical protein [Robiginitomaculum sp.]